MSRPSEPTVRLSEKCARRRQNAVPSLKTQILFFTLTVVFLFQTPLNSNISHPHPFIHLECDVNNLIMSENCSIHDTDSSSTISFHPLPPVHAFIQSTHQSFSHVLIRPFQSSSFRILCHYVHVRLSKTYHSTFSGHAQCVQCVECVSNIDVQ